MNRTTKSLDIAGGLILFLTIIASAASLNSWGTLTMMSLGVLLLDISLYLKIKQPYDDTDKKAVSHHKRRIVEMILLTAAIVLLWISAILRQYSSIGSVINEVLRPVMMIIVIIMLLGLFIIYIQNDISVHSNASKREQEAMKIIREGKARRAQNKKSNNKGSSK